MGREEGGGKAVGSRQEAGGREEGRGENSGQWTVDSGKKAGGRRGEEKKGAIEDENEDEDEEEDEKRGAAQAMGVAPKWRKPSGSMPNLRSFSWK